MIVNKSAVAVAQHNRQQERKLGVSKKPDWYWSVDQSGFLGAIHKGRPHPRGEARGGLVAKADVRKFRNFTKIFNVQIVSCVIEDNICFDDNH